MSSISQLGTIATQANFEAAIIAELEACAADSAKQKDESVYLAFADWLIEHGGEPMEGSELVRLVLWMRDKPHWPIRSCYPGVLYSWWLDDDSVEWSPCWRPCCRLPRGLWGFVRCGLPCLPSIHPTLIDALGDYWQAWQARQLMRDGSHVAEVPPQVAVCPVCGSLIKVESYKFSGDGFPKKDSLVFPIVAFNGDCSCNWQDGSFIATLEAVARWCKAV